MAHDTQIPGSAAMPDQPPRRGGLSAFALLRGPQGEIVLVICGLIAATQMVWGVLVPILPAFASSLGIDTFRIGLIVAGFGVGRIVANIPAGLLSKRVSRVALFTSGASGVVLFSALSGLVSTFEWLLVLRVLTGVAGGITITCGQTLLADAMPVGSLARAMSLLQGLQLAGGAIGPAVGALAAAFFGMRAPFYVSGLICAAFVVWILGRGRLRRSLARVAPIEGAPITEVARRSTSFLAACAAGFAVFFSRFGVQQTLLPLIAFQGLGLSATWLGMIFSGMAVLNVVCVLLLGGLSDRWGRRRVIVLSLLGTAAATAAFALPSTTWLFILIALVFGVSTSIGGPVPAAYVAEIVGRSRRGPAIGVYRTFGDLAGIVGPIAIGFVLSWSGFTAAILMSAGVCLAAGILFAFLAQETVTRAPRQTRDKRRDRARRYRTGD